MPNSLTFTEYEVQLDSLKQIVESTKTKIILDNDTYFTGNVNFFTKSFLVNTCAYLESFIKEISIIYVNHFKVKVNQLKVPKNIVTWNSNLKKQLKDSDLTYGEYVIKIKKKDLDEHISGSPFRTIKLFKLLGKNLGANQQFNQMKDQINMIVVKRNKILHHNDDASDLSLDDILLFISDIIDYMKILDLELKLD